MFEENTHIFTFDGTMAPNQTLEHMHMLVHVVCGGSLSPFFHIRFYHRFCL